MLNAATSYLSIADEVLSVFIDAMNYIATDTILVDDSFWKNGPHSQVHVCPQKASSTKIMSPSPVFDDNTLHPIKNFPCPSARPGLRVTSSRSVTAWQLSFTSSGPQTEDWRVDEDVKKAWQSLVESRHVWVWGGRDGLILLGVVCGGAVLMWKNSLLD